MFRYAQINDSNVCISVSELSGEVESEKLILISEEDDIELGDIFDGELWTRPEPVPYVPTPSPEQIRIEQLEADNAALWYENMTQSARVEANEAEVSALWYEIMTGGV